MNRAVCCVPVSPLRAETSHKSEMVSQLIFGECCEILEERKDNWVRVSCDYDDYEGWCTASHLAEMGGAVAGTGPGGGVAETGAVADAAMETGGGRLMGRQLAPDWVNEIAYNGQFMMVPLGSSLGLLKNGQGAWGKNKVVYKGLPAWDPSAAKKDAAAIRELSYKFLNTPYLWGGKTVFGIDCSGFTQMILKFLGVPLLRDAYQQATQGSSVGFLQEARTGDLAFFDNDEGRITHVGILLNDHEIIHASGKVRVDKIDNMGILQSETFQRTHHLRVIKRMLPAT